MTTLAELARAIGLPACAEAIGDDLTPAPAPLDAGLAAPRAEDAPRVIGQMIRRSHDPALVAALRRAWAARPLDRALLAWDVLHGAVLSSPAEVDELRRDARLAAPVLLEPGNQSIRLEPGAIEELVQSVAAPAISRLPSAEQTEPGLGLLRLHAASPAQLEAIREYGRLLHRAHLPASAAFCLADLFFHHRHRPALADLVEVLLDSHAPDVERWLSTVVDPEPSAEPSMLELRTYARERGFINADAWDDALRFVELARAAHARFDTPVELAARINPRPTLAYAEAAVRCGEETVSFEHVAAITQLEPAWRYAFRVMVTYAASRTTSPELAAIFEMFLEKFGNDHRAWADSYAVAPEGPAWAEPWFAMLVRELRNLPHDAALWRSAAEVIGGSDRSERGLEEVDARIRSQAAL